MKRGEIWSVAAGSGYGGKPRPAVVIQDDLFAALPSATVCLLSTDRTPAPLFRVDIAPTPVNGLKAASVALVDKLVTIRRDKVGRRVGILSDART